MNTLLFYYLPLLVSLLLWNGLACVLLFRRRGSDPRALRLLHYLVLVLMLPGLICDVGGMSPDTAVLFRLAWLYPAGFLLAALANFMVLRRSVFRRWLLPVPLVNLWLGVVYLTRYLAYLGVSPGLAFEGMQVAYAMVQSATVNFLYIFFPILNLWPVLVLPAKPGTQHIRRVNLLPAAYCVLFLGVSLMLLPRGYRIAASWHRPLPATAPIARQSDFRGGVVLRISSKSFPTEQHFRTELDRLDDLGARAVNLFVHDDLMAHEDNANLLGRFLEALRGRGVTIILTADFPEQWFVHPPTGSDQILAAMCPFHRFLAVRYQPDILVPFIEPYGAFLVATRARYSAQEWEDLLAVAITRIGDAAPGVRCAVYLGHTDDDRDLYERVCGPDSPVDVVGFSFYAVYQTREEMETVLSKVRGWVAQYGQGRPHWVFEFGQSPLTMGGERAQSHYIQFVSRWAASQPDMEGACVFALGDYEEKMGLLNSLGRKRPAYDDYRALIETASTPADDG